MKAWSCKNAAQWVAGTGGPGRCAAHCGNSKTCTTSEPPLKLEVLTHHTQGYGGPDIYSLRIVYDNAELERQQFGSAFDQGRAAATLEAKWQKAIDDGRIETLAAEKPRAFHSCTICAKLVRQGGGSIHMPRADGGDGRKNHFLCKECGVTQIDRIRAELTKDREAGELDMQRRVAEASAVAKISREQTARNAVVKVLTHHGIKRDGVLEADLAALILK